jgi:hypothetical protein
VGKNPVGPARTASLDRADRKAAQQRRTPKRDRKFDASRAWRFGGRRCSGAFPMDAAQVGMMAALAVIGNFVRNLFARQSRFHLIKLEKTIALHAYATII